MAAKVALTHLMQIKKGKTLAGRTSLGIAPLIVNRAELTEGSFSLLRGVWWCIRVLDYN